MDYKAHFSSFFPKIDRVPCKPVRLTHGSASALCIITIYILSFLFNERQPGTSQKPLRLIVRCSLLWFVKYVSSSQNLFEGFTRGRAYLFCCFERVSKIDA